jgi:hypothetical protein
MYPIIIAKLAISFTHGTSLTYCSYVCKLCNKGRLKALEVFFVLSLHIMFEFLGYRFPLVISAFGYKGSFGSNFSTPSITNQ